MDEEILALCMAMGAGEDRRELLLPLIEAVRTALAARLRPGVAPEDCGGAFPVAAAMEVMDHLNGAAGLDRVSFFTAGDLSIRTGEGGTGKISLSGRAERLLAPWLGETGFAFKGVPG